MKLNLRNAATALLAAFSFHAFAQTPSTATAGADPVNEAQISAILQTANQGEIEAGQLAAKKAQNAEVKKYAEEMVKAHTKASHETDKVAKSMKMKGQEAADANAMKTSAEQTKNTLNQLNGVEFDKAYVNSQVSMHQEVLNTIDTKLMPAAKSASMKGLLQKLRPDIEAHLKHAEALKAKLM